MPSVRLCYCETVKNITISLDDETYRKARILAAERDTSVSALAREFFNELAVQETEFERLRQQQNELIEALHKQQRETGEFFNAADRMTRDEAHDRKALR